MRMDIKMALKMQDIRDEALRYGIMGTLNVARRHNPNITFDEFYQFLWQQKGLENISEKMVEEIFYE